jgi:hypothetical protein
MIASRSADGALMSFRLLATEVDAFVNIDRELYEERAAIREYEGGYSRNDAELLAAWELTQALFARLTAREWLARYAPERLLVGDKPENYPAAHRSRLGMTSGLSAGAVEVPHERLPLAGGSLLIDLAPNSSVVVPGFEDSGPSYHA